MARYKALVAGASGVVGRRLAEHLAGRDDWEVIGLSRRAAARAPFRSIEVDLTDSRDCAEKLSGLADTTHILYAARYQHTATTPEPIDINAAMLKNVVGAVAPGATGLQHGFHEALDAERMFLDLLDFYRQQRIITLGDR